MLYVVLRNACTCAHVSFQSSCVDCRKEACSSVWRGPIYISVPSWGNLEQHKPGETITSLVGIGGGDFPGIKITFENALAVVILIVFNNGDV